MNLVNRQSARQNALLSVSRGVDYKNNIDLLKKSMISGWPHATLVIWSQQIRSYLKLNENLESNISIPKVSRFHFSVLFLKTVSQYKFCG